MKNRVFLAAAMCSALSLTACGDKIEDLGLPPPPSPDGCAVHLFATTAFQKNASNDIIEGAGKFSDLKTLPGTARDWSGQVKSVVVGKKATLQVWEKESFQGATETYSAYKFNAAIKNFASMEISCN